MLPAAVGVAISPFPIIASVLFVGTPRGRANGPAFVLGCALGTAVVGTIVLVVAAGASASEDDGDPATWVSVLELVLGLLLLLVALKQWRGRPPRRRDSSGAEVDERPRRASARRRRSAPASSSTALNPKNLILTVAGAAAIAQTGIPAGEQAVALALFVVIGCLGVATPVAIALAMGDRSRALLDGIKDWMARNNTVIMVVILALIGVKLIGDAISGFSS